MESNEILMQILNRLESMDNRLGAVENKLGGMDDRLGVVENKLGDMNARMGNVEQLALKTQLTLENDISKKLSALYDGHMLNTEKLEHISDTVDDIESSVVALDVMNKVSTDEIIKLKFIK